MNVLLACSKYMPEYSGAGFRAHNLYKRLISKSPGISLTTICGSETENSSMTYDYEGFRIHRIANKKYLSNDTGFSRRWENLLNFHRECSETRRILSSLDRKPDFVHVFGQNYVTVAAIDYAIRQKIPLLIELVTDMPSPFYYVPFPYSFTTYTRPSGCYSFVCISEKLKDACLRNGIPESHIWCRPNPVDEGLFHPVSSSAKQEIRRRLTRFGEKDILISYIAKFRPSKNHKFLVEVMKHLPQEFKLFMKGPLVNDGPLKKRDRDYFNEIGVLAKELGMSGRIQLEEGFCSNAWEYYQMSDIYAFPSLTEGLGTPVLESIACGIPVVSNRIKGVTDVWIKDGCNGFLSSLDAESFSAKISAAASFPKDRMSDEARNIMGSAGTGIIDAKYLSLMDELNQHKHQ